MTYATNTRLSGSDAPPAPAPAHANKVLDRLAQHHRDQARISTLAVERDALLAALKKLVDESAHLSPFVGEPSVRSVRQAGKYMQALDAARAAIALYSAAQEEQRTYQRRRDESKAPPRPAHRVNERISRAP